MEQKLCKHCGREIIAEGRTLFCCAECQVIFYNKKKENKNKIKNEESKKRLYVKICRICGIEFKAISHKKLYCSKKCSNIYRNEVRRKDIVKKNCAYCGKEFETNMVHKIYCSRKCSTIVVRNHKKQLITCINCGKEFICTHKSKIYCNKKCRIQYRLNNKIVGNCVYCGKEFIASKKKKKYCSLHCSYMYRKKYGYISPPLNKNKTCKYCGKEMDANLYSYKQLYCSVECRNISHKNRYLFAETMINICKYCGKEFIAQNKNKLFCSQYCCRQSYKKKYRNRQIKTCLYCGKKFVSTDINKLYCIIECYNKHHIENKTEKK